MIEELDKPAIKSHDLIRLQFNAKITLSVPEEILLGTINEVYIDARYPGDLGLLPHGKPTVSEINDFINFCESIMLRIAHHIG